MPTTWYPFRFDNSTRCKGTSQSDGRTFVRRLRTRQEINFCVSIQLKDTGGYWRWIFRIILRMFEDGWAMLSLYIELITKPETWGIFFWGSDWQGALNWGRKVEVKVAKRTCGMGFRPKNWGQFHPQSLENFRQACPSSKHECERYCVLVHKRFVVHSRCMKLPPSLSVTVR